MAMSATIALSSATCKINQQVLATVTVSNSGGSDVTVTGIRPTILFTNAPTNDPAAAAVGAPAISSGFPVIVPASGTLKVTFGVVPFISSGTGTFSIGAICTSNDGSVFSPTATTLTSAANSGVNT